MVDRGEFTVPCPALLYSLSLSSLSIVSISIRILFTLLFSGLDFGRPKKKGKGTGKRIETPPSLVLFFISKKNFFSW